MVCWLCCEAGVHSHHLASRFLLRCIEHLVAFVVSVNRLNFGTDCISNNDYVTESVRCYEYVYQIQHPFTDSLDLDFKSPSRKGVPEDLGELAMQVIAHFVTSAFGQQPKISRSTCTPALKSVCYRTFLITIGYAYAKYRGVAPFVWLESADVQ